LIIEVSTPDCADVIASRSECQELLAHLTTAQSIAVRLSFVGYSHAEIGVMLGVSRQAVTDRVRLARRKLGIFCGGALPKQGHLA